MIPVEEALARIFALCDEVGTEEVPVALAAGRVLAAPVVARRDQPPFRASVMDGYAVRGAEVTVGARFRIVGQAPAGHAFSGRVGPGEAVRIFTGAPVPEGADHVVIQEDTTVDGDHVVLAPTLDIKPNIREAGADFRAGDRIEAPRRLRPADLALVAAMNAARVTVRRRPVVAILPTGDELVQPGSDPRPDQIVASNAIALKAMVEAEGAEARLLPIARDRPEMLHAAFRLAEGADMLLTIGGASVGDHDLVGEVAATQGVERAFYKVAMRPGKPLMAGRHGGAVMIGLPGNPVSAIVCGMIFVLPALRAMQGLGRVPAPRRTAPLAAPLEPNGPREHYMRAVLEGGRLTAMESQDSSLLGILSRSNALIVRPVGDPARAEGEVVEYLPF
jgi:molybdopterin molybdotransferase